MAEGIFLSLEGVEGAGKSTLADTLETRLRERGHDVLRCREPGGTSLGEAVRAVVLDPAHGDVSPWAELFLMLAARAQIVHELIEPALAAGRTVLCDRFLDASTAYQPPDWRASAASSARSIQRGFACFQSGASRRGPDSDRVDELNRLATRGRVPDLTLLLDLDPADGRTRQKGAPDRMEGAALEFHRDVRRGYLRVAEREPGRFVVLDAASPADEVARRAWEAVTARLLDRE